MNNVMNAKPELTYGLGPVDQIPMGEGRLFQVEDAVIAVFRTRQGDVYATQATCPHRGGPLIDGIIGGRQIACPLHTYRFDLSSGEPIGNECDALRTYQISLTESGEMVIMPDISAPLDE